MRGLLEALLAGPVATRPAVRPRLLLTLPLLLGVAVMVGAAGVGAWHARPLEAAGFLRLGATAGCVALLCLVLAAPAASRGMRARWFVPLWVGPQVGAVGWSLLPAPRSVALEIAGGVALLLPVMTIFLAASRVRVGTGATTRLAAAAKALLLVFALALSLCPLLAASSSNP